MKTKFLIPFLLSAVLIFPQYVFQDSFADNSNSTSNTNDVNTATPITDTPTPISNGSSSSDNLQPVPSIVTPVQNTTSDSSNSNVSPSGNQVTQPQTSGDNNGTNTNSSINTNNDTHNTISNGDNSTNVTNVKSGDSQSSNTTNNLTSVIIDRPIDPIETKFSDSAKSNDSSSAQTNIPIDPVEMKFISDTASSAETTNSTNSSSSAHAIVNSLHSTIITITPSPASVTQGSQETFTVTVADNSTSPTTPTGNVSWSDANVGGTFNPTSCTLSSGDCTTVYTPSANSPTSVTISATYGGDSAHSGSTGTSQLSMTVLPASLSLTTDQSYYAYGDVVTLTVSLPGQSLQNIAVGISDPNGNNIIARTITTDQNGNGTMQFKIPNTYQTGVYQDIATAIVDGKSYTNSTKFTVIQSHGISIDSVQITDQQGNSTSMLKQGQNGFVKVSISSGEKMPALLTLNLFDANQSSLGTASIQSVVNPGKSQVTLSFFIPASAQAGVANVYADAYSDWPSNGGTPLTTESCLAADLQNPSTLSVSYVPNPPHSCTTSSPSGNGLTAGVSSTQPIAMINNQAQVTLGVAIQNDSMTFMSPAEAHLLALAYANSATNTQNNSVALVSLNLNNMNSTNTSTVTTSGNVTTVGPAQFTTIAGPDIQNNPVALKILQEIQASKRQVANILGNETADKLNQQLVLQQRQAAADQLKQALGALAEANSETTPDVAYANFLTTVGDNRTQAVFQNEYNFLKQRVDAGNAAMQTVLNNGGSLDQALQTFNQYATINRIQMVSLNSELNVAYGLADNRIQSCFNSNGQLTVVNGINPCVANIENNSTGPSGISIISVQPTDQLGNPVSLLAKGHTGYVKVIIDSNVSVPSLVTINLFDSNIASLGTVSAQYTLNPGQSEVILPYYVSEQSGTGLASIYANVFTDWPNKGGTSQTNELSSFVGIS